MGECDIGGWLVATTACLKCWFKSIDCFPTNADPEHLECGRCGAFNSKVMAYHTPVLKEPIREG